MLKKLQKLFAGNTAQTSASAEQEKEVVNMTTETEATVNLSADNQIAELSASLLAATESLAANKASMDAMANVVAEMTKKLDITTTELSAIKAAKAALDADVKAKAEVSRKSKLEAAVGTDKAPALLESLKTLDDAAFDSVVGAMSASFAAEANSAAFKEVGVAAEAPKKASATDEESAEMKLIKARKNAASAA